MARNEVFRDADHLSLPVPANTTAGTPVIVGSLVGITQTARGQGGNVAENATVWLKGGHRVDVTGAIAAVGTPVYIPSGGGALTATASGNTIWGYALETKGSGTGPIVVKIAQV